MASILKKLYTKPLFNLGEEYPEYKDIYSPHYDKQEIGRFMTSHYKNLKNAQSQAKAFDMTDYYYSSISKALKKSEFSRRDQKLNILDIGCGFGSTTFPLLKLFPKAQIIASELSVPMLFVLKQKLTEKNKERIELLQLNAEELDFKKNSFDLIVGAAILHHLFHPEKTVKELERILKPGGVAIFFEPFEEGTSMMALIYQTIIYHGGFKWLNFIVKMTFRNLIEVWWKMKNLKKSDPFFRKVDDKWLFSKQYFRSLAAKNSFGQCIIYRLDQSSKPFTHLAQNHFGKKTKSLPKWIFKVIDQYEEWLSEEVKNELIIEGCIILKKAR